MGDLSSRVHLCRLEMTIRIFVVRRIPGSFLPTAIQVVLLKDRHTHKGFQRDSRVLNIFKC
jgi:hypothetical protein